MEMIAIKHFMHFVSGATPNPVKLTAIGYGHLATQNKAAHCHASRFIAVKSYTKSEYPKRLNPELCGEVQVLLQAVRVPEDDAALRATTTRELPAGLRLRLEPAEESCTSP